MRPRPLPASAPLGLGLALALALLIPGPARGQDIPPAPLPPVAPGQVPPPLAPLVPPPTVAQAAPAPAPLPEGVKVVEFDAPSVGRKLKYNVVLPRGYESGEARYPVLYLLHGFSGNYLNWARMQVPGYARSYDLIVVMPDAGNSWYANWAESEGDAENAWEDYMIKDLVGHVDATYRTVAGREGRAITGLSMGGYGALMLGLKHPEMFASIGSHSGAVAFAKAAGDRLRSPQDPTKATTRRPPSAEPNLAIGVEGFSSQADRTPKGKLFATPEQADACDPFLLVKSVPKEKLPHIYLDCGTDDRLIASNQDFVKLLMAEKIPFTYAEGPGGHDARYWSREVGHSMAVQYHILRRNLAKLDPAVQPATP